MAADRKDPHELADDLSREADRLERESREVETKIDEARQDWQQKRADGGVPGAPPPEGGEGDASDASSDA